MTEINFIDFFFLISVKCEKLYDSLKIVYK